MTQSQDVIDMSVIDALRELGGDGDETMFRELLDLYIEDSTSQLRRLVTSLQNNDWKVAERIAHTLKSSSANLGAHALSKICLKMEQCGRNQNPTGMTELISGIREEHQRAIHALKALRT